MKIRLDALLIERNLVQQKDKARALIGAGEVLVNERVVDKVGHLCDPGATIRLRTHCPYVSRGGLKLAAGLDHFRADPSGLTCIDIGASSGGFTDCLLQHGADKIYAVDVAYGQLSWKIRQDPRVVVLERCNARLLTPAQIPEPIDLAVMDVSFISITKIIPVLLPLFTRPFSLLALIKPQFELPKEDIPHGGVVLLKEMHQKAIELVTDYALGLGLKTEGTVPSPVLGPKGNREFLIYLHS
ncbi:TlyA family RNA methyltransferase [Desulfoprunum benzoelyticum]|uniref:23S rRNA (Cytidine1920-2'-O)/16S rRNA (Cytidine1409-2'-O)-methyltransferase n=1 Tax=Desulfoprunum benzoelyticum TaxID=1506996 RepID=A0A840UY07_9BACT|nr:23S rRNA (cytidine1920-2'-O)/16S rRNA (cytidine1409-2'-O)-methyltransferase [Desulfoprunum benzoelyticum]MBM9528621.1 TlyA family RNA methyltransferase [Desulfoprunum benzoelyticum]